MNQPFVIERTYNAPVEKVWKAITDKSQMKEWYFDLAEFKPELGFEFSFTAGSEDVKYVHLCKVTQVIENERLAYSWKYKDYEGNSEVIWELFPEGDKTKVRLTHAGLDTFPQDKKDFRKESFAEGWNQIVGRGLKEFVEK